MRIIMLAAMAALFATPALAESVHLGAPLFEDSYSNRGQCQSALSHERNAQRKEPARRGADYQNLSPSDFQAASLRTTRCELVDGEWKVMFNAQGFSDAD